MYDKGCKCGIAVRLITATLLVAAAMAYGSVASAQLAPTASLSDEITAQYKLTKFGVDSTGFTVTEAGTVLMVQKGGILAFPPTDMGVLATKYENGAIHSPSPVLTGMFKQNVSTRFLTAGERVYVSKLDINMKTSKISVSIVECDSCNGVQNASSYKAVVTFSSPRVIWTLRIPRTWKPRWRKCWRSTAIRIRVAETRADKRKAVERNNSRLRPAQPQRNSLRRL